MEKSKHMQRSYDRASNLAKKEGGHESLARLFREMADEILHDRGDSPQSLARRTKKAVMEKAPKLRDALQNSSTDIVRWMNRGGPWRAFLVTSVGIILLLALTGLSAFMLFFVTATANAVAIGFLASLAAVGAFVGLFFTSVTAIYIGALAAAVFTISIITCLSICAAATAAGWICFLWIISQGARKVLDIVRGFLVMVVSAGSTQIIAVEKRHLT